MKKILGMMLSLALVAVPLKSVAEPILQRIERTGTIRAGAWKDAKPFGYVNEKGEWVGYSIDIMRVIQSQVETALDKPIKLELVEVDTQNFLDHVRDRKVDISCGPTSFTWNRERYIDFSISYFVTGTQVLVKKGVTIDSVEELKTKRIGVEANTTNEAVLKTLAPDLQVIVVNSRSDGFAKLQQGVIDGYAGDGILLEALKNSAPNPEEWDIIPNDELVHLEAYACVLPQDDSHWRDLVNYSILRVIQGCIIEDPEFSKMFAGWFGEQGVSPYPEAILQPRFRTSKSSIKYYKPGVNN